MHIVLKYSSWHAGYILYKDYILIIESLANAYFFMTSY